jgi:hypothetical protein
MDQRGSDIPLGAFLLNNVSLGDAIHRLMLIMLACAKSLGRVLSQTQLRHKIIIIRCIE